MITQNFDLHYLDYYLPSETVSVAELVDKIDMDTIPPMFETKSAYLTFTNEILEQKQIRVENTKSEAEMLNDLISKLFLTRDIKASEIDLIITCKEGSQSNNESFMKYLQLEHKMTNANVLNISGNHCANIPVIWDLIKAIGGDINNVLVLSSHKTELYDDRILGAYGILSDGAGIMLLSKKKGICSLIDTTKLSNAALYKVDMNKDNSLIHYKYMVAGLKKIITNNEVDVTAVKSVIPQNANILLLSKVVMGTGLDTRTIFTENMGRCGHIDSVDFIINLKDVIENNIVNTNDKMLVLNMGWAGSYVSSLIVMN